MVPKPQGEQKEQRSDMGGPHYYRAHAVSTDKEIVISGMAGKFPMSDNVAEFANNLYNSVDMIGDTKPEWLQVHPLVPKRIGQVSDIQKFDATFFGVQKSHVNCMDPQCRQILEQAYMAIMDAGVNPNSIRGSRIGVYIASCFSESEKLVLNNAASVGSAGIIGCSRAMYANRISYTLGLTGPSLYVDTACSSSMYALDSAYAALRSGVIDGAVVGGTHLILHPYSSIHFVRLGVLSSTSNCRPFDQDANGYVRSEGVGAIFLQRRADARRIYATLVHSKTNCDGFKTEGITYPSNRMQEALLKEFYDEVKVSVDDIGYMEAHSTGTVVGDPEECAAIDGALCQRRSEPLLVGSVKSNIGHTEPASGICSIVKVMIAFQNNKIPPNINFTTPKKEISALIEGRMQVIDKLTELKKPYVGINSFGFGGANAHILVKQFDKLKKKPDSSHQNLPRVLLWSGRTQEAVEVAFKKVENKPVDPEFIALMHSAQAGGVPGMVFRGFNLLKGSDTEKPTSVAKEIQHYDGMKRPIVWVFSGMGSQWPGMGAQLMHIPLFRESIQRCHDALKPTGLDLIHILTSDEKTMYDNITHSFIGIAAIQIALVDILRSLDMEPDFIIGHSTGELGCAYADGCFTLEQMIMAAYYRGKVSLENKTIRGSMAAIGLSYNAIRPMLPEPIEVACHNSDDSCTISGPAEDVAKFVAELKAKNIFAREVACSNIAFHTRYIAHLGGEFLKYLKQIVPAPKRRSDKWLSTSVPHKQWTRPESQLSSAEYHTNNLLSSVFFEESCTLLPKNSLIIEIAPHALLQSILRSAIPKGVYVGLTQRNNKENHAFFLAALGKLYLNGLNIPVDNLYPKVEWPVSRGTETISDVVKLDHREDWPVHNFQVSSKKSGEKIIKINMETEQYLAGHNIDGKILLPATYYVENVWNTFLMMHYGTGVIDRPIEIENLKFVRATTLTMDSKVDLNLMIHFASGNFEIVDGDSLVVCGTIREITDATRPRAVDIKPFDTQYGNEFTLSSKDIYKELKLRGYYYSDEFKGVESIRGDGQVARLKWTSNWVTFMDCMLQTQIINNDSRDLCLPTKINKIRIFGAYHTELTAGKEHIDVYLDSSEDRLVGGGVEIIGLEASPVSRRKPPGLPVLERYQFIPNAAWVSLKLADIGRMFIQLVLECDPLPKMRIAEVISEAGAKPTIEHFHNAIEDLPVFTGEYSILSPHTYENLPDNVVVTRNELLEALDYDLVIDQTGGVLKAADKLNKNAYVVVLLKDSSSVMVPEPFVVIATSACVDNGSKFMLLRQKRTQRSYNLKILKISSSDSDFKWLKQAQEALGSNDLLLVAEKDKHNGVLGLTNCLRKEYSKTEARCLFIDDPNAPDFDPRNPLYANQLALGMAVNVFRNGQWGTFRHLQLVMDVPEASTSDHVYGNITQRGDLSSLRWLPGRLNPKKARVQIVYSSLNFKDIMLATGRISSDTLGQGRLFQECMLGLEFAGIERNSGKRVMGMVLMSAVSNYIDVPTKLTLEVPKKWTLREAASVPVVYLTVYYAFFIKSDIRMGKSILIHAGTGGVGLAAIRTALAYGLEVFTTVSTAEKRNFLLKTFPGLKASHIGNSRDTSFEAMIKRETNGKGVSFVLNSLSEEKLVASIRCLAHGGVFLEIGKFDMANDNLIGLAPFLKELSFVAVFLDLVVQQDDPDLIKRICDLIEKDIASGIVQPLPTTVFPAKEIERAFRFLASGKHIGKVLIQVRETEDSDVTLPIRVMPLVYFSPDLSYIVTGGLGGFGLELVDWMILRGARKIVLSSSRGISNGYQSYRIRVWKSYGCEVRISTANIGLRHGCEALIRGAMIMGPVGGIFNLAVVLKDAMFENQTTQMFKESMLPKAVATKLLDELSRELCPNLKHFVIFSSVSCGRGNPGQTNYGMANSVMERIIEDRVAARLPGKAIEWGAVGEVGLVAVMAEDKIDVEIGGTLQQRISSCLRELDVLLSCPDALTASMVVAEKQLGTAGTENILQKVMNIMSIRDMKSVSYTSTLSELGMDSLIAVDIKQTLERDFGLFLSAQELRTLTLQKLEEYSQEHEKTQDNLDKTDAESAQQQMAMLRNLGDETDYEKVMIPINHVKKGPPIFFLSGIEGSSGQIWLEIGKKLKAPAYIIRLHNTAHMKGYDEVSQFVYEHIKTLLKPKENYRIVAYSYGTTFALKAAHILERKGHAGKLFFIDGSPLMVSLIFKAYVQFAGKDNFDSFMLANIVCIVSPDEDEDICRQDFSKAISAEDKQKEILKYAKRQKIFSADYFVAQCADIQQRSWLAINLDTSSFSRVAAPICLVKSKIPIIANISSDYDLNTLTTNGVDIQDLDGNHFTVLENPKLPELINKTMLSN